MNCLTWYCPSHLLPSKMKRLNNQNEGSSIRKFLIGFNNKVYKGKCVQGVCICIQLLNFLGFVK